MIRGKSNSLYFDYYQRKKEVVTKTIHKDFKKDFDVAYDYLGKINIVYRNIDQQLVLTTLSEDIENSIIIEELTNEIYYLNFIVTDVLNIFYLEESGKKNIFNIVHLMIEEDKVHRNIVDRIVSYNIVQPIQVRRYKDDLIIFYYYDNIICLKVLSDKSGQWEKSVTLTDNSKKLYLDSKIISNEVHLVYSIFEEDQFYINYESFLIEEDYVIDGREVKISDLGNHTDPILIKEGVKLNITWKETNTLYGISSDDNGESWGEIKEYPQVKRLDMVKYKYINKSNYLNQDIDYSYGSTDPIKFIGF